LNHDSASRSQPAFCRSPFNSKIAFGPKQTSTAKPNRLDRSKMTQWTFAAAFLTYFLTRV
jgi:hypothetical protein